MDKDLAKNNGKEVLKRISNSSKILIIPDASRVDYDCLGTAIALKKFLQKLGKEDVKTYIFAKIPDYLNSFGNISHEVETKYINEVDFNYYDLIFIVDINDWDRALTRDYQKILDNVDKNKFINIDHHIGGTISKDIPDNILNFHDVCTSKVLYDTLIEPSRIELDSEISNALYLALIGDSAVFRLIRNDTFEFAQKLINNGADHNKITDFFLTVSKGAIDYFQLALENTKYYPDLKLTVLAITEDLYNKFEAKLGDDWRKDDYAQFYKDNFIAKIAGYDYGITFRWDPSAKGTRISFRTRSNESRELLPVLESLGFKVGGHRNAGGGFANTTPQDAEKKFVEAMKAL